MKWKDEIVEEVRATREAYAAQFNYDLKRMFEDLKAKEVNNPARRAELKPLKPHVLCSCRQHRIESELTRGSRN